MTRAEAIKILERRTTIPGDGYTFEQINEALDLALAALRGPTREMVERMRGEWIKKDGYTECSKCEYWYDSPESEDDGDRPAFCPACGAPMTDEAVQMVMERLEALKDGKGD